MVTSAPALRLGGRSFPVVLPSWRDPRLHVAAVIGALQVLGQTALGFELSVAQILVCLGVCAVVEVGVSLWRDGVLLWPASALLTGNSVAFILRTAGTRHGDWWSLDGIHVFVVACLLSMGSKYLVRRRTQHIFNPSNFGLVATFLLFGSQRANPQDLWWGPLSPVLWLTLAVILGGGLLIARRLRMLAMVAAFWLTFAACIGVVAASGHCMTARWQYGAVCGSSYWTVMLTSPEVLVFLLFMITDPRTAPTGAPARIAYGAGVAYVAALLAAPMRTEFATKVAVLGGLAVVCGLVAARGLRPKRLPRTVLAAMAAAALVGASIPARAGPSSTVATAPIPASLPPIRISEEARRAVPGLDGKAAEAMVAAVLAERPTHGSITAATVVLLRDPADPQASPTLGVELTGQQGTWVAPATGYHPAR